MVQSDREIRALNGVYSERWFFPSESHDKDVSLASAELSMSVNIGQYTDIAQYFAWSCGTWDYVSERYTYEWPRYDECPWAAYHDQSVGGNSMISNGTAMKVNSPSRYQVATALLPTYAWNGSDALDESSTPVFCLFASLCNY